MLNPKPSPFLLTFLGFHAHVWRFCPVLDVRGDLGHPSIGWTVDLQRNLKSLRKPDRDGWSAKAHKRLKLFCACEVELILGSCQKGLSPNQSSARAQGLHLIYAEDLCCESKKIQSKHLVNYSLVTLEEQILKVATEKKCQDDDHDDDDGGRNDHLQLSVPVGPGHCPRFFQHHDPHFLYIFLLLIIIIIFPSHEALLQR